MPPPPRRKPPLFSLRSNIPLGTGRLLGLLSFGIIFIAWCICSYVMVNRGSGPEPLVSHFFLPAPDEVLKSLLYLFFEQDLGPAILTSLKRIGIAFGLSIAVAVP